MRIDFLLQAIGQVTDYQTSFTSNQDFYLNGEKMKFENGIVYFGETKIRTLDSKELLYELKLERVLQINSVTINNILKILHKLERDARKNKTIQIVCN